MKCYVSAPMRGIPEGNFPAIDSVTRFLRRHGWEVYSPADNDRAAGLNGDDAAAEGGPSFKMLMRLDLWQVCDADAIVLLPGWEKSRGALLEKFVAEYEGIELKVYYAFPAPKWRGDDDWFISEIDFNAETAVSA